MCKVHLQMKFSQRLVLYLIRTKLKLLSAISKKKAAASAFRLFCTPIRTRKKNLTPVFSGAKPLSLLVEGMKLRGWRWKQAGSASQKRVLILHGFESSAVNFDRYIMPLVQNGFEVYAFDAPAHGQSDGKTITVLLYKRTILEICKTWGPIHSFIAHSFGGLSLSMAMEEMKHDHTFRMVLIAPATESTTAVNLFFHFLRIHPAVRPYFEQLASRYAEKEISWFSVRRAMYQIHASVLWIHDEDDDMTPLQDVIPVQQDGHTHIRFLITKGLGHRRIYRDNQVTKAILEFLN